MKSTTSVASSSKFAAKTPATPTKSAGKITTKKSTLVKAAKAEKLTATKITKKAPTERKSSLFRLLATSKAVWSAFTTQKGEIIAAFTKLGAIGAKASGVTRAQLITALPNIDAKNISFYLSTWQSGDAPIVEKLAAAE